MLWLRGDIWHIKYREVKRHPDGCTVYFQHSESTHSTDREYAQRMLNRKLQVVGGRRAMLVDPKKVTYDDLKQNFLTACVEKGIRSIKTDADGKPTLGTLPRLDGFFDGYRAAEIGLKDLRQFRIDGKKEGLSDARLNRYMATLRAAFRQALKDEIITREEMPAYFPMTAEPNVARNAFYIQPEWYPPPRVCE